MDAVTFGVIGLATGALYGLIAIGLVVVYRGSGVVNFALGGYVMAGGYAYYEFKVHADLPSWISVLGTVAFVIVVAVLVELLISEGMRSASALARVMVTLGVLVTLNAIVQIRYENRVLTVPSLLPTDTISFGSAVHIGLDRLLIIVIGSCLAVLLWSVYRYTPLGRLTSTIAEKPDILAASGHSPRTVAVVNTAVAGALCGLAGILIPAISGLNATSLPLIVLPGMAAAVIGAFASFPIAFAGGLIVGIAESEALRYVTYPGVSDSIPFLIIIGYLAIRGRGLPLRSHVLEKLPVVGNGRLRLASVLIATIAAIVVVFKSDYSWQVAITASGAIGIVALSVVLVTGYAGQVTLSSFVVGGAAAFLVARAESNLHWDLAFVLIGVFSLAALIGFVVGLPSLRTRGVNLTIVTLGLGVILYSLVLTNSHLAGGVNGIEPGAPSIFGISVDPLLHPDRYGAVCLLILVGLSIGLANLRRGQAGRRLLAVRGNERAAASLGVNVYIAKLYAFTVSSGFAAIGVTLFAFMNASILPSQFDVLTSISVVTLAVIGGVGLIPGAVLAGAMFSSGVLNQVLTSLSLNKWLPLIGGISTLLVLRFNQDGVIQANINLARAAARSGGRRLAPAIGDLTKLRAGGKAFRGRGSRRGNVEAQAAEPDSGSINVARRGLTVEGLTVAFGGVVAVKDVSLRVEPGTVHGLIGPNGAGKTTFIDAVTGFVKTRSGRIQLDGTNLSSMGPGARSRAGLRRSFQARELFSDLTVGENIGIGCDDGGWWRYVSDFFHPGSLFLSPVARVAIRELQLQDVLHESVTTLSFGLRGLTSLARVIAGGPSVVLLDEPASGFDPAERLELATLVRRMAQEWGMSVLIVEHDVDLVWSLCDDVTVLVGGAIVAQGSPADVRNSQVVREAYMGLVDGDSSERIEHKADLNPIGGNSA